MENKQTNEMNLFQEKISVMACVTLTVYVYNSLCARKVPQANK